MVELTEELKAKLIEEAKAAEGQDPDEARAEAQAAANLAAVPAPEIAKVLPPEPVQSPSASPVQGVDEWGPYDDYVVVTTPYGQYGVPKGQILHFEQDREFIRREGQWRIIHLPRYRDAVDKSHRKVG